MELKDYLRIFQRRWPIMIAFAGLTAVLLLGFTYTKPVPYYATSDVHFKKTPLELGYFQPEDYTYPFTEPTARFELFHHPQVLARASEILRSDGVALNSRDLEQAIKVSGSPIQNTVTLRAEHATAEYPLRILRALYQAYIEYTKNQNRLAFRKALERVDASTDECVRERESLQEKLRAAIGRVSQNVFDSEIQGQILSQLILDLEKARAANHLELRKIEIQLRDRPEAERRRLQEEQLRHHLPGTGAAPSSNRRVRELQAKLAELRKRYFDGHPSVAALLREIEDLQAGMADEIRGEFQSLTADLQDRQRLLETGIALTEDILRSEYERLRALGVQRVELDSLKKQVGNAEERHAKLRERKQALLEARDKIDSMTELSIVVIKESPAAVPVPVSRRVSLPLMVLVALILGTVAGGLVDVLSTSLRTASDVKTHLNLPTIAMLPYVRNEPLSLLEAATKSPHHEVYSKLAVFLDALGTEKRAKSFLFTSTKAGEGKTTVSSNVAIALAKMGRRVLLIDSDIRRPQIHMLFGLDNSRGLSAVLSGELNAERELNGMLGVPGPEGLESVLQDSPVEGLKILTSGPISPSPLALIRSEVYDRTLRELCDAFDFVLMDSPPLLGVVDAAVLAPKTDLTVVVLAEGEVDRSEGAQLKHALNQVNATIAGVVINKSKSRPEAYYYYYHRYRSYGLSSRTY